MTAKYGNLPFGQVYKLLISIIGRDAALAIADEHDISITGKDLDRVFAEEAKSFIHLNPSKETSPLEIVCKFFEIAEKKPSERGYEFPTYIKQLFIVSFFGTFRDALRTITPYEKQTTDTALHLFNWFLGYLGCGIQDTENNKIHFISKNSIKDLLNDSYENIFNDICEKLKISRVQLYSNTETFYKVEHLDDFEQAIKRAIDKSCKNNTNDPWIGDKRNWYKFKAILDYISSEGEKELVHRLIGLYFIRNTETALNEICGIEQNEIYNIKQDILLWANNELPDEPNSERLSFLKNAKKIAEEYDLADLSLLQEHSIDPLNKQKQAILESGVDLWGKTAVDPNKDKQLIETMGKSFPICKVFFTSWARARLDVLSCKFDGSKEDKELQQTALKYYHKAFEEGRNFAGESLKAFLEESIAATVYFNRRETKDIPKVIDPNNQLKTPITDDVNTNKNKEEKDKKVLYGAKQYYEYGYALNFFEQESSDTYFLHFHAEEHFWNSFQIHQFAHSQFAEQKRNEDILKVNGLYLSEINTDDPIEIKKWNEENMHTKKLWNKTEKSINDRFEIQPGYNIQYTPMSFALITRQLDIAEHYLNDFANTLNVTVINTHGSTALLEALTQYKKCRFFQGSEQITERYKKIIMELIRRSSVASLYAETVKNHISVLEEAINTFDIEIVKAIVEKDKFNINNIKISADEFSPLYYTVNRLKIISDALMNGSIELGNNITWKNFNIPGISTESKQKNYNKMQANPLSEKNDQFSQNQFIGNSSIWKQECNELLDIVQYLIDKTEDVDAFEKKIDEKSYTNVLSLAVESNFYNICRKLIEKGADPARIFPRNGKPYDSPFIRAVRFKSWDTLKMLLTEFMDKIKYIINERFNEEQYTAAHLLFRVGNELIYKYEINQDNFKIIEEFIPLFRNAGADFNIPDIRNKTVRTILKGILNI